LIYYEKNDFTIGFVHVFISFFLYKINHEFNSSTPYRFAIRKGFGHITQQALHSCHHFFIQSIEQ
jgi:hypothetical protein